MRKCLTTSLIVCFLFILSSVCVFGTNAITGTHKIEGINSGTRTFIFEGTGYSKQTTVKVNESFSFNIPGDGTYTLKEESVQAEGLVCDNTVYTIVVDKGVVVIKSNNDKVDSVVFEDKYTPKETDPEKPKDKEKTNSPSNTDKEDTPTPGRIKYATGDFLPYILGGILMTLFCIITIVIAERKSD